MSDCVRCRIDRLFPRRDSQEAEAKSFRRWVRHQEMHDNAVLVETEIVLVCRLSDLIGFR
jgi:hypothetical protein